MCDPNKMCIRDSGISEAVGSLTVFLHTAGKGASCPYCGHFSHRLHSYYSRHIQDLEVYGHTLELVIKVGKYYCDNVSCPQKIFCEPCLLYTSVFMVNVAD